MGQMRIMDGTGDTKIIWDKSKKAEVDNAKNTFDDLKKKGYLAYTVEDDGKAGEVVNRFNKNLEMIILAPPMAGG